MKSITRVSRSLVFPLEFPVDLNHALIPIVGAQQKEGKDDEDGREREKFLTNSNKIFEILL